MRTHTRTAQEMKAGWLNNQKPKGETDMTAKPTDLKPHHVGHRQTCTLSLALRVPPHSNTTQNGWNMPLNLHKKCGDN